MNNFKPDISIDLEVADQRLVQTKGMGEITGKISNIHVAPTFGTSLLSVYQMYKEGKGFIDALDLQRVLKTIDIHLSVEDVITFF